MQTKKIQMILSLNLIKLKNDTTISTYLWNIGLYNKNNKPLDLTGKPRAV